MDTTTQSDKTQLPRFFEISKKIEYLLSLVDLGYWIFPLHDMTWVTENSLHLPPRRALPWAGKTSRW